MKTLPKFISKLSIALTLLVSSATYAADLSSEEVAELVVTKWPGTEVLNVEEQGAPGFFEILTQQGIIYISKDGNYMFYGKLLDITPADQPINVTDRRETALMGPVRIDAIAGVSEQDMVVFKAPNEKHVLTVFTDVDCGYCRKLHTSIDDYLAQGVTIRYMAFPRAGLGSDSYRKLASIWCADDRQAAMTEAKSTGDITAKACENPVADQYNMVRKLQFGGTPAIVFPDGSVTGYVPPDKILEQIAKTTSGR